MSNFRHSAFIINIHTDIKERELTKCRYYDRGLDYLIWQTGQALHNEEVTKTDDDCKTEIIPYIR